MRMPSVATVLAVLLALACGKGDGATGPEIKPNTTFTGVFSSGVERGTVTMVSGTPATGTLTLDDGSPVSLTGTFTAATSSFSLSGGGFTVNATTLSDASSALVADATYAARPSAAAMSPVSFATASATTALRGTVTGPGISGVGTLAAMASTAAATSTRYCGVYTGDDSGMGDFVITGTSAVASISGMGGGFAMSGTVSGSSVVLKVTGTEPGTGKKNTVTAALTLSGTSLSGIGSSTLYPSDRVNITASSTACLTTAPSGPYTSYIGYVASPSFIGKLTLVPGAPASGSLEWLSPPPQLGTTIYGLTGTFNATTGAFNLGYYATGNLGVPAITVSAVAKGATVTGTAQGGLLVSGGQLSLVGALGNSVALPVVRRCGTMTGGTVAKPGGMNGSVMVMQAGTKTLGVAAWNSVGQALSGTAGATWLYLAGATDIFFAGTGTGAYNGTWAHVNNGKGTFSINNC